MQRIHDGRADAETPVRRDDGHAADFAAVVEIESAGSDRRVAVEREHVDAERVTVVELELARHALLVDEHGLANAPDAFEVSGEIGDAREHGSLSSSRSRAAVRGLRQARGRYRPRRSVPTIARLRARA